VRPKHDLVSYAVLYWPKHYALVGSHSPNEEGVELLKGKTSETAWWSARYVLSNHMVRLNRGYLSPLPIAAMTGMDDLVDTLLQDESAGSTCSTHGRVPVLGVDGAITLERS